VEQADRLRIDDVPAGLAQGRLAVRNQTRGLTFAVRADLSERERRIVLAGGRLNLIRNTGGDSA